MIDTSHVPSPDPTTFWPFEPGQTRIIGVDPLLSFRVDKIFNYWVEGTQVLGDQTIRGSLHINVPVVISKSKEGVPQVTLTLRKVEDGKAYLQVTANPSIAVGVRQ